MALLAATIPAAPAAVAAPASTSGPVAAPTSSVLPSGDEGESLDCGQRSDYRLGARNGAACRAQRVRFLVRLLVPVISVLAVLIAVIALVVGPRRFFSQPWDADGGSTRTMRRTRDHSLRHHRRSAMPNFVQPNADDQAASTKPAAGAAPPDDPPDHVFHATVGGNIALEKTFIAPQSSLATIEVHWTGEPIQFALAQNGAWVLNEAVPSSPHSVSVQLQPGACHVHVRDHDPHVGETQDVAVLVRLTQPQQAPAA